MDEKLKVSHRVELENPGRQFRQEIYQTTLTSHKLGIHRLAKVSLLQPTNTNSNAIDLGPRIPLRT